MEDLEKKKARSLRYYHRHKKKIAAQRKKERQDDPERFRKRGQKSYRKHSARRMAQNLRWRRANPDRVRFYNKVNRIRARKPTVKEPKVSEVKIKPIRLKKPTKASVKRWAEKHLEELSKKTVVEIVTDPELLKLIEEQEKDARRYMIKYDYSFETVEHPPFERANSKTVYDDRHAGIA